MNKPRYTVWKQTISSRKKILMICIWIINVQRHFFPQCKKNVESTSYNFVMSYIYIINFELRREIMFLLRLDRLINNLPCPVSFRLPVASNQRVHRNISQFVYTLSLYSLPTAILCKGISFDCLISGYWKYLQCC